MSDAGAVAVVVPLSDRDEFLPEERVSLRHLFHHLGDYEIHFVAPPDRDPGLEGRDYRVRRFDDRYFGSMEAHTRLLLSRRFYEAFDDYEYILMYHLDALVFSDRLREWCGAGYDFIGAPWLNDRSDPEKGFWRVGNGGFSLRRVSAFLDVLDSDRYREDPEEYWERCYGSRPWYVRLLNLPKKYLKRIRRLNGVEWDTARWHRNEDHFWSLRAEHYDPEFRIAPVEEGLRFSFEVAPRYCYRQNDERLPFGCHAWPEYDPDFWEPYLIGETDAVPTG